MIWHVTAITCETCGQQLIALHPVGVEFVRCAHCRKLARIGAPIDAACLEPLLLGGMRLTICTRIEVPTEIPDNVAEFLRTA